MALPITYANRFDLLRVAFVGTQTTVGTSIVNVQWYRVYNVDTYVNDVVTMGALATEAKTIYNANVVPQLSTNYVGKSIELTLYKNPYRTELPDPNPLGLKRKMIPFATYIESNAAATGGRMGPGLPDYAVYRPIKYTGRAGRSWRGNMAFSPLLEGDTDSGGNTWSAGFLLGAGLALRGFMVTDLFTGDVTKEWVPVMFRITEYLKAPRVNPLTVLDPTDPVWTPVFEARNANNLCGILRRRKARIGT